MKTKTILIAVVLLMSASCSLFGAKITAGVAKTVNGGADWQLSNTIKGNKTQTIGSLNVTRMAFDPGNREVVYAGGANDGLYKSEDSGASWTRILSNILVYDFVINPFDGKTIYVTGLYNDHGRVLVTKDGGGSWQQIFNDASIGNPVRTIALNPANPNQLVIGLAAGGVVYSADSGLSWKLQRDFQDRVNHLTWNNSGVFVLMQTKGLFNSQDNGVSFNQLTTSINPGQGFSFNGDSNVVYNEFFVDPVSQSLIYVTTSAGIYKTTDAGKTWESLRLPVAKKDGVARAIAIANTTINVVITSVGSTIYKSLDGGSTWQTQKIATTGIINYILIDPQLPQIVYAGVYGADQ